MKTVFVAMSGGVDSSVAVALLKKRGFDVVGVFMKPWSPYEGNSKLKTLNSKQIQNTDCLWRQDREDALRVAAKLNIPLLTWDLSKEYEKYVAQYMIEGYRNGITPNPDVMCNKFIKFGVFLDRALALGADYIATGHYVRLKSRRGPVARHHHSAQSADLRAMGTPHSRHPLTLLKAKDQNKDQSYFLYTLTQEQLKYCLFPVGDYTKDEVRKMAKKFCLPNWDKKDSQGVCFVGPIKFSQFLKNRIKPKKGLVLRKSDGKILGEHDGVWYYTIGQRHIGLSAGAPYFIVAKDVKSNTLYVDTRFGNSKLKTLNSKQIQNSKLQIKDFNWIDSEKRLPMKCKVKTRYRQEDLDCTILKNGSGRALIEIKRKNIPTRPVRSREGSQRVFASFGVAPGQSAVFYKGNEVLGGGVII